MPITGGQIRSARGFLQWTAAGLAERSGVALSTVRRAEDVNGIPPLTRPNLDAIRRALEEAGICFLADNGEGPGVRLRPKEGAKADRERA
jgi:hypothetical protein